MDLLLKRKWFMEDCIIGELYVNSEWECYTLEDVEREVKIPGKTAIPEGIYQVVIDWSYRYKREMPRLLNVPGFEGIRIHSGNTANDTEGCILVGQERKDNSVLKSRLAYIALFTRMYASFSSGEEITITIEKEV